MLSGSSVCATVLPYLNNYFLEKYGWRDSFWILSAISLNTCMLGALVRPIELVTIKSPTKCSETIEDLNIVKFAEKTESFQCISFLSKYSVALCLLLINFFLDLCFFVPNVFLVPLVRSLGYTNDESALLLSFISIGDIISRPFNGVLMSRFQVLTNNILLYLTVLIFFMSLNQLFAAIGFKFAILILYTLIHGCLSGFVTTSCVTAVPSLMGTKNLDKFYGIFFAVGSFSLLASAPLAGKFVSTRAIPKCQNVKLN